MYLLHKDLIIWLLMNEYDEQIVAEEMPRLKLLNEIIPFIYKKLVSIRNLPDVKERVETFFNIEEYESYETITKNKSLRFIESHHVTIELLKRKNAINLDNVDGINVNNLYRQMTSECEINAPFVVLQFYVGCICLQKNDEIDNFINNFFDNNAFENEDKVNDEIYKIKIFKYKIKEAAWKKDFIWKYVIFFDEMIDGKFKFKDHNIIEKIHYLCMLENNDKNTCKTNNHLYTTSKIKSGSQIDFLESRIAKLEKNVEHCMARIQELENAQKPEKRPYSKTDHVRQIFSYQSETLSEKDAKLFEAYKHYLDDK